MSDEKKVLLNPGIPDFPANSKIKKESEAVTKEEPATKAKKVVSGSVITKKKGFGKKLAEVFVGENAGNVSGYILHDVLIPAAKATLSEMVSSGIEMLLFGEARPRNSRRDQPRSYVNYSSISSQPRSVYRPEDSRRDPSSRNRAVHDFDDVLFTSRFDAQEVLDLLIERINKYDQATIMDLYDLSGITSSFVDDKWGWTNLSSASISRDRRGEYWVINLPRAIALD